MGGKSTDPHAELAAISKELHGLVDQANANSRRIGELYNRIVREELAQKAGYETALEYFAHEFGDALSQATLTAYGAVEAQFSEQVCIRFGVWKLSSLITYAKEAELPPLPADPGPVIVKVPKKDEKGTEDKPFAKCSSRNLKAAISALKGHATPPPQKLPGPDEARVKALETAVLTAFGEEGTPQVKAYPVRGATKLDFTNVPLSQVETFLDAINKGLSARTEEPSPTAARLRAATGPKASVKTARGSNKAARRTTQR